MKQTLTYTICALGLIITMGACSSTPPVAETTLPPDLPELGPNYQRNQDLREALLALQRVHFAKDSDVLTLEAREALTLAARKLKRYPTVHLQITGHADPRGSDEYNIALGARRARMTANYLATLGVSRQRLSLVSMGEEQPLTRYKGDTGLALNRRVDFRLTRGNVELILQNGDLIGDDGQPLRLSTRSLGDPLLSQR